MIPDDAARIVREHDESLAHYGKHYRYSIESYIENDA